jgi:RNA polymerase sigma factor (sigma-70 family)
MPTAVIPPMNPTDRRRRTALFHFIRLQLPELIFTRERFDANLARTFGLYLPKCETPVLWIDYLDGLYALDWAVCFACLEGQESGWDALFAARTGRGDALLVDALRMRAARLYPRNAEQQETAVSEFWSHLLAADTAGSEPVLARYDGRRPLTPWLIRVFQNRHLSKLRVNSPTVALPDDELALPVPGRTTEEIRWHDAFADSARDWLDGLADDDRLLLGLRWRYRLSQRDAAKIIGLHEGTLTRRTDKLRDQALETIGTALTAAGWTGDDLESLILTELGGLLADDPRLSAVHLAALLRERGMTVPVITPPDSD